MPNTIWSALSKWEEKGCYIMDQRETEDDKVDPEDDDCANAMDHHILEDEETTTNSCNLFE